MTGPIVISVSGKRRFTAWAITCAEEWRRTSRPSRDSGATGARRQSATSGRERSSTAVAEPSTRAAIARATALRSAPPRACAASAAPAGGRLKCCARVAGAALRGVLLRRFPVPALPALPLRRGLLRAAGVGGDPRPRLLPAHQSAGRPVPRAARARRAGAGAGRHPGGGPALVPARLPPRAGGDGRLPPPAGGRP